MKIFITNIIGEKCEVMPIGNHELNRHLVYRINTTNNSFVFKFYYKKEVAENEILALRETKFIDIPTPSIIETGFIEDDREWLLMNRIEGFPLAKFAKFINHNNLKDIYYDMGKFLARLHKHSSSKDCRYFKDTTNLTTQTSCKAYFEKQNNDFIENIITNNLNSNIISSAINYYYANLDILDIKSNYSFCHNDYDGRNVLIAKTNGTWKISAILDFERSMYMDRTIDFCFMYINQFHFDKTYENSFFQGYKSVYSLPTNFKKHFEFFLLIQCLRLFSWSKDIVPMLHKTSYDIIKDILNNNVKIDNN
ncbi:aminoglycoside phosphotransferase family protein [Helicovermis profundi]